MEEQKQNLTKEESKNALIKALMQPTINEGVNITQETIVKLQLNKRHTRENRRRIARKAKIDWNFYKALEYEVMKRLFSGVDLVTGKPILDTSKNITNKKEKEESNE
jgi:hypothetical protein